MNHDMTTNEEIHSIDEFVEVARVMRDSTRRSVLGIAGPPGAGKSTFARALVERLWKQSGEQDSVTLLPMDGFHLPNSVLDRIGLRDRKGAPDTFDAEGYVELLRNVLAEPDRDWFAPDFSRVTDEPVPNGFCIRPRTRLVVTEGNYLLLPGRWAEVRQLCAEVWYLDVDHEVERSRLIKRQINDCGRAPEAAIDWVDRSDLANAAIIRSESTEPHRYIKLANGAV